MRIVKRFTAVIILLSMVCFSLTVMVPSPARGAGSAPVLVVNTPAQPVPVKLQETGGAVGTVNAMQSGRWDVGVVSLPAIQLAPAATVDISNTPSTPIFTSEVGPATAHAQSLCMDYGRTDCAAPRPPRAVSLLLGQRFVIEYVSSSTFGACVLSVVLNGQSYLHRFQNLETSAGVYSTPTRIYADGGYETASITLDGPESSSCFVTLSGYLVPIPIPN